MFLHAASITWSSQKPLCNEQLPTSPWFSWSAACNFETRYPGISALPCFTAFAFSECFRDCINDQTNINSFSEYLIVKEHMCLCHDGPSLLGSYLSGHRTHVYILSLYFNPQLRISIKWSEHFCKV